MTRAGWLVRAALAAVFAASLEARALAAQPEEKTPGVLIQEAARGPMKDRFEALDKIGTTRDRESIRQWKITEALVDFARDRNPVFAKRAVKTLGKLCSFDKAIKYEVLPAMVRVLQDTGVHNMVRIEAASQLAGMVMAKELQDRSALDALVKCAEVSDANPPEVAAESLRAVGRIGDPRARSVVRDNLTYSNVKDKDVQLDIRTAAVEALLEALKGQYAKEWLDKALGNRLLDLLDDDLAQETRDKVLEVIARVGKDMTIPKAEEKFLRALREAESPDSVLSALKALTLMGSTKASGELQAVYDRFSKASAGGDRGEVEVRTRICSMAGELLATWSAKEERSVPAKPAEEIVDLLIKAMADKDRGVVLSAVIALGNLYDTRYDRRRAGQALVAIMGVQGIHDNIKSYAIASMEAISGRVLGEDPKRWEAWIAKAKNLKSLGPLKGRG